MSHQLRCINCGINVFRMQRHLVESDDVRSLLSKWTSLSEITNESVVCHYCWLLIEQTINPTSNNAPTASIVHRNLCIGCGHSLHRVRSHALHTSSEREDAIKRVIEQQIAPLQLRSTDKICHPCWQRSYRSVQRNLNTPSSSSIYEPSTASVVSTPRLLESESSLSVEEEFQPSLQSATPGHVESESSLSVEEEFQPSQQTATPGHAESESSLSVEEEFQPSLQSATPGHVESESSLSVEEEFQPSLQSVTPGPSSTLPVPLVPMDVIELLEFGRAPDTQARCFFPSCRQLERLSVPISIRRRLFSEYNYYVPENCRICSHHLRSNDWPELMEFENVIKQRFKIFRHEFNNRASPHVMIDFSIAAALINRFRPPLTDRFDAAQILEIIQQKCSKLIH